MKPGRAAKPTNIKLIQGNPGKRPISSGTLSPDISIPKCPDHLNSDAKEEWSRVTPLLMNLKVISEIDMAALALYCQSYGRWVEAERKIDEMRKKGGDGLLIKSPNNYPIQNPYLAIANRSMEDCYKYLQQFGLSPSARTRVTISVQGDLFGEENQSNYYFT